MKSVLISIQPKWCELIANGKKTIEVRKTKPKIDTPFKCYIYCTNTKPYLVWGDVFRGDWETEVTSISGYSRKDAEGIWDVFNGKVIGEFVCDHIMPFNSYEIMSGCSETSYEELPRATQLSREELLKYCGDGEIYTWHISDLVIYDKPKELSEFIVERYPCLARLKRPPQSWCYVEGGVQE